MTQVESAAENIAVALSDGMFAAAEMVAGGDVDFEAMKVAQLKAELAVRGSTRTGLKARRRCCSDACMH